MSPKGRKSYARWFLECFQKRLNRHEDGSVGLIDDDFETVGVLDSCSESLVRRCGFGGCPQSCLTQAQLGERVGIAQQQIASFEIGRRRMPISVLPLLAKTLGTSIEALISDAAPAGKRGPAPKLQQQLEQLSRLPKTKQRLVSQLIESVLAQADR